MNLGAVGAKVEQVVAVEAEEGALVEKMMAVEEGAGKMVAVEAVVPARAVAAEPAAMVTIRLRRKRAAGAAPMAVLRPRK